MATSKRTSSPNGNRGASLEQALAQASDTQGMLREASAQTVAIEEAANRIAGMGAEQAAASEQIRASVESMAASIEESATAMQELARSQAHVSETTRDMQQ